MYIQAEDSQPCVSNRYLHTRRLYSIVQYILQCENHTAEYTPAYICIGDCSPRSTGIRKHPTYPDTFSLLQLSAVYFTLSVAIVVS
jgi:hypothetical protein